MKELEHREVGGRPEYETLVRALEAAMYELDRMGHTIISAQLSLAVEEIRSLAEE